MSGELVKAGMQDIILAKQWGQLAKSAGIIPPNMTEHQAAAIVQTGRELGLQPFQSLRNMSFINGRITMSVQLQLALARAGGVELPEGWLKEEKGKCTATLVRGKEKVTCTYTHEDAVKAGLVKPGGNYDKYQRQMLRWRCIGDGLRLIAPDLVMGLLSPEEAASIPSLTAAVDRKEEEPFPADEKSKPDPEETPRAGVGEQPAANEASPPAPGPVKGPDGPGKHTGTITEGFIKPPPDLPPKAGPPKPPAPKAHRKGMAGFLQSMEELKKRITDADGGNDEEYYKVLYGFGMAHANEVKTIEEMKTVYRVTRTVAETLEQMAESDKRAVE